MRKMRSCIMGTQGSWKEGILGTTRDMTGSWMRNRIVQESALCREVDLLETRNCGENKASWERKRN